MEFKRAELKWPLSYFALHNTRDYGGKFIERDDLFLRPSASDSQSHSFKSIHNMTQ